MESLSFLIRAGACALLVVSLQSFALAAPSMPQCTGDSGLSQNTCHDVVIPGGEGSERGRLCIKQYAPYVRSRVEGGWGPKRYLNLCRYEVRLTTEKPGREPVVRFAHSYEKDGNVLLRKSRSFYGKPSLDAPESLTFKPSVESTGIIQTSGSPWVSTQIAQGAYDSDFNRISGDIGQFSSPFRSVFNTCSDCNTDLRSNSAETLPIAPSKLQWIANVFRSPKIDQRLNTADESESTPLPDGLPISYKPAYDPQEARKPWRKDLVQVNCNDPRQRVRLLSEDGRCKPADLEFTREFAQEFGRYAEICARKAYPSAFAGDASPLIDIVLSGDVSQGRSIRNGGSCDPGNLSYHSAAMAADLWQVRIGGRVFDYERAYLERNGARKEEWNRFWGTFATCMGRGKSEGKLTFDELWSTDEREPPEGPFWVITAENSAHRNHMHVNLTWSDTERAYGSWMDRFNCHYLAGRGT